jgi:hypothetical protein
MELNPLKFLLSISSFNSGVNILYHFIIEYSFHASENPARLMAGGEVWLAYNRFAHDIRAGLIYFYSTLSTPRNWAIFKKVLPINERFITMAL